jgi:hypothetical protein
VKNERVSHFRLFFPLSTGFISFVFSPLLPDCLEVSFSQLYAEARGELWNMLASLLQFLTSHLNRPRGGYKAAPFLLQVLDYDAELGTASVILLLKAYIEFCIFKLIT